VSRAFGRGGVARAAALSKGRATPFYAFSAGVAERRAGEWASLDAGEAPVRAFYPYKCNRHPRVLEIAARAGLGAEVTIPEDLEAALAALPGERVLLQAAAPPAATLDRALGAGVRLIADGPDDAAALLARARAAGVRPAYLLRLRPSSVEPEQARFGMPAREAAALARRLVREGRPLPDGIAFHLGTRLSSAAPFVRAIREAAELAAELERIGVRVGILDVGGGFPAELERLPRGGVGTAEVLEALRREARRVLPGVRLLAEPGRAIAADAFHLVARVVGVRGRTVRLDASRMSHAFFVPRGRHPFVASPLRDAGAPSSEIVGPLPVGLDAFSDSERVGRPRPGDRVVIGGVGAYNLIAANGWAGRVPEVVEIDGS